MDYLIDSICLNLRFWEVLTNEFEIGNEKFIRIVDGSNLEMKLLEIPLTLLSFFFNFFWQIELNHV